MKFKTVKRVIRKKMEHWIDGIGDKEIAELVRKNAIVSGGAISSLIMGEKVNDYDVYFRYKDATAAIASYYVRLFKENPPPRFKESAEAVPIQVMIDGKSGKDRVKIVVKSAGIASDEGDDGLYKYFESLPPEQAEEAYEYVRKVVDRAEVEDDDPEAKDGYTPRFLTSNAITLTGRIQVVIRFYGSPDEIHENFDFAHCKCSYNLAEDKLVVPMEALECMVNKELRYATSRYPLCSFIRTRKFLGRGWHINAGQYVKMAWDLNQLDLSDLPTLEDQMIGVDTAYFHEVIAMLRDRKEDGKKVDETYLFEIIDRVF